MHISEGVLSTQALVTGFVLSAPFLIYSFKKIDYEEMPLVAALCAIFFISSFIHIPLGVTSLHLVLGSLVGIIVGVHAFLAIFVALILQALLFGYGGISTIGANLFLMAFPSFLAFYSARFFIKKCNLEKIGLFLSGSTTVIHSSFWLFLFLYLSGKEFISSAKVILVANLPLAIVEGIVIIFLVLFLKKVKRDILWKIYD